MKVGLDFLIARELSKKENKWDRYEVEKADWLRRNPEATPKQYEKAVRDIARRLGV